MKVHQLLELQYYGFQLPAVVDVWVKLDVQAVKHHREINRALKTIPKIVNHQFSISEKAHLGFSKDFYDNTISVGILKGHVNVETQLIEPMKEVLKQYGSIRHYSTAIRDAIASSNVQITTSDRVRIYMLDNISAAIEHITQAESVSSPIAQSGLINLIKIPGLKRIFITKYHGHSQTDAEMVEAILNKHRGAGNILACKIALYEAGLKDYAKQ